MVVSGQEHSMLKKGSNMNKYLFSLALLMSFSGAVHAMEEKKSESANILKGFTYEGKYRKRTITRVMPESQFNRLTNETQALEAQLKSPETANLFVDVMESHIDAVLKPSRPWIKEKHSTVKNIKLQIETCKKELRYVEDGLKELRYEIKVKNLGVDFAMLDQLKLATQKQELLIRKIMAAHVAKELAELTEKNQINDEFQEYLKAIVQAEDQSVIIEQKADTVPN
jgi:hypothetical protein